MSAPEATATDLPELFYTIADAGSATARRYVVEHGLEGRVRFRNVYYDEVRLDFEARGGEALPAYWDGQRLVDGEAAVLAALEALARPA
jgi:hypothetical protein